ncbi:MAG: hypothetical protein IPP51_00670 [Bacteroidetes bacterium]|nr:hypothetical protein [Bacteroidota bacterium]
MAKKHSPSGIYFIPAFLLISFSLFFSSCSKEELLTEPSPSAKTASTAGNLNNVLLPELFGIYTTPSYLTIGNTTSENTFLLYLKNKGGNMVNCYARNSMATASGRTAFAAFCRKAVSSYGIKLITCDIREITEIATWDAFYTSYPDLRTVLAPLTEKEPWVTLDYAGCFNLLRQTKAMCSRYGAKFYFYEGWMGKNYSNPQAAVDSMVYYCDGIFLSNYVTATDYLSTAAGYGKWDNRIKYRVDQGTTKYGGITVAAKRFNKLDFPLIELQSVEPAYLYSVYSTTGSNRSFYGSLYTDAKTLYNLSSADVLKYTELRGKSFFHLQYVLQAQPN